MSSVSAVCGEERKVDYESDESFDENEIHEMTRRESELYIASSRKSGGFDVIFMPNVCDFGIIQPEYRDDKDLAEDKFLHGIAQEAIKEYNSRIKDPKSHLEFVKLVKAMGQAARGLRYYITFDAKVVGADDGNANTYQAVVLDGIEEIKVQSFRLKPPDDEDQGSSKGWFWEGHIYIGLKIARGEM